MPVVGRQYCPPRDIVRGVCQAVWTEVLVPEWAVTAVITPVDKGALTNGDLRMSHYADIGATPLIGRDSWETVGFGNAYPLPCSGGMKLYVANDAQVASDLTFTVAFEELDLGERKSACGCSSE